MAQARAVLQALRRILRATDLHSGRLLRDTGLTATQLQVLHALSSTALTAGALARELCISQATLSDVLERLEARHLVTRERQASDKRRVLVALTDEARQVLAATPNLLHADFLARFGALAEWEQLMILASLQRVAELMNAADLDVAAVLEVSELK
jgi:DNA-binding MarR family transcriptional regulator